MIYITLLLSYLIGSVTFALIVGKLFYKTDVRNHNSKNLGATNTLVTLGKKAGIMVAIGDISKGVLSCSLPMLLSVDINPLYCGIAAIIGHCFPIFAGFRGGKAIATTFGVLLFVEPLMCLVAILSFFGFIFLSKYVFIGSLSMGLSTFIYSLVIQDKIYIISFGFLSLFIIYLHRSNIKNFINKVEPKINKDKK